MLDSHLLIYNDSIANTDNTVFWKDYRITILFDRLIRIEKSKNKKFRDNATQSILFRNTEKQEYSVKSSDNQIKIYTQKISLILKDNIEDGFVTINGKQENINNDYNLKGTYCTLDCCNGKKIVQFPWASIQHAVLREEIELENGVCSKNGVAVIDDSTSLSIDKEGHIIEEIADGKDLYLFAYGEDYKEAIRDFYKISGACPIVPRFALGNWWSRYHRYNDREYLQILNRFEQEEIPLTVATIDMDWHYSNPEDIKDKFVIDEKFSETELGTQVSGLGWTGYSWNTELFPNYKEFLKKIDEKGLKITLNVHPSDGIRFWENQYKEFCAVMGIDSNSKKQIQFDICNDEFINNYFKLLHKPYEQDGVAFWWLDWQQGQKTNIKGLTPLWALNHYHFLDNAQNNKTPLILSRYAGVGSHRYPLGFSGDTLVTWDTLKYLPQFTATASNIGYAWWSHDIGGHMMGKKDDELYVRMVQFGVFSPINRLHCSNLEVMTKEPWYYKDGYGLIAEKFLRLRHKLIPYLYTATWINNQYGQTLIEPLYYYNKNNEVYNYPNEYYFGGQLLVSPITSKRVKSTYSKVEVWLPNGRWTDIFTGETYDVRAKGKKKTLYRNIDSIPVLAKAGAIIPYSLDKGNNWGNPQRLQLDVYSGNGEYTLYEDNRHINKENVHYTVFKTKKKKVGDKTEQILEITSSGDNAVIPNDRVLRICFKNIYQGEIELFIDNKKCEYKELLLDNISLEIDFEQCKKYKIKVTYKDDERTRLIRQFQKVLTEFEFNNCEKNELFEKIKTYKTRQELKEIIKNSSMPKAIYNKMIEWL